MGRAGREGLTVGWKRDNVFIGLFYGIGREREKGGVVKGSAY
jgi:hypothetical protein